MTDNCSCSSHGTTAHRVLRMEAPIRSSPPAGIVALAIGLCLVLHTPAWVVLVSYQDAIQDSNSTLAVAPGTQLLRFLSWWILECIPWLANALLSFFLGGLFLYLGVASIRGIE
eukprot:jgi/Psemu1/286744/fgenesh1_pg.151_\